MKLLILLINYIMRLIFLKNIENVSQKNNNELLEKNINLNEDNFKYYVDEVLSNCEDIADSLEEYTILKREFFDFLEIQCMVEDILEKNNLEDFKESELDFLIKVFNDFADIMLYRYLITDSDNLSIDEIPEDDLKDYVSKYGDYIQIFRKNRENYALNFSNVVGELDDADIFMFNMFADHIFRKD